MAFRGYINAIQGKMNNKFTENDYIMYSMSTRQLSDETELKCISKKIGITNSNDMKNDKYVDFYINAIGAVLYLIHVYTDDEEISVRLINDDSKQNNLFVMYFFNLTIGEYLSNLIQKCKQDDFIDIENINVKPEDKIVDINYGNGLENIKTRLKSELSFVFRLNLEDIILDIYYSEMYREVDISNMGRYLINIYKGLYTMAHSKLLCNINYLEEGDKNLLIYQLNDTDYESDYFAYPVHTLIEHQVMKTPEAIALVHNEKYITYKEMNGRANQIARYIKDNNLVRKDNGIIGIMFEPSIEMVIIILAIWKSGYAYVPLDPEYPVERVKMILDDCNTNILIKSEKIKKQLDSDLKVYEYIDVSDSALKYEKNDLNLEVRLNDLCYVLFTSGSTGRPKGVMIEHKQSVNTIVWYGEMCKLDTNTNCILSYNYTSDPSVEDMFSTLIFGARLYIPQKEIFIDKKKFGDFINKNKINVFNFVPRVVQTMLCGTPKFESLEYVLSGGDVLTDYVKDELIELGYIVINDYGPTEVSVDCLSLRCDKKKVTLGYPINNMKVYVLDKNKQLKPIGAIGELYVSGIGVSRGYINREDLTKKAFFEDPFCKGNRMYKTGDVAMWNSDGQIEFLGRKDNQVKINGYRIELHEIEQVLLRCDGIKEAVVVAYEEGEIKYLCAFYITDRADLSDENLKEYLKMKLPAYMTPRYYVRIDNIPLTPIGKTDYKKLKKPQLEITNMQDNSEFEKYRQGKGMKEVVLTVCKKFRIPFNINFDLTPSENGFDSFSIMVLLEHLRQLYDLNLDYEQISDLYKCSFREFLNNIDELIENTSINAGVEEIE